MARCLRRSRLTCYPQVTYNSYVARHCAQKHRGALFVTRVTPGGQTDGRHEEDVPQVQEARSEVQVLDSEDTDGARK